MTSQPKSEFPTNDEFPSLTKLIQHVSNPGGQMNAHVFGALPHRWAEHLAETVDLARRAMIEIADSDPNGDDVIKPEWDMKAGKCLYTQKLSGDAYLDLMQLQGEEVNPRSYKDPPESH